MSRLCVGRRLFGFAAIAFGLISIVWNDLGAPWQQIPAHGNIPHREILVYIVCAIEISGGIAIQWRRTARGGAFALGSIFALFALLWIPKIIAQPSVYDGYGNFFEQLSIVTGAMIVYGSIAPAGLPQTSAITRIGYYAFAACVVSFAVDHIFYFSGVVAFVPQWIPPGRIFWAATTTIAFALAAVALLSRRQALLAARLLTVMVLAFGLLIWLPRLIADPHHLMNWAGNAQNSAIAGAAWILADYLNRNPAASVSA